MKIYLAAITALFCACLLSLPSFGQTTKPESDPEEIANQVKQAMLEKQAVIITLKPGVCLAPCSVKKQSNQKSQKFTGRIVGGSATSFTLENDKSLEQFFGRPLNYQISYSDVQVVKPQNEVVRAIRIVGDKSATVGVAIALLPILMFTYSCC